MNLGKIELEKVLVVKDNEAFAFVAETGDFKKINGCEYFKALVKRNNEINAELEALEKRKAELEFESQDNKRQCLELESANYCPMDFEKKTVIGGVVVSSEFIHRKECGHRG